MHIAYISTHADKYILIARTGVGVVIPDQQKLARRLDRRTVAQASWRVFMLNRCTSAALFPLCSISVVPHILHIYVFFMRLIRFYNNFNS